MRPANYLSHPSNLRCVLRTAVGIIRLVYSAPDVGTSLRQTISVDYRTAISGKSLVILDSDESRTNLPDDTPLSVLFLSFVIEMEKLRRKST
ncbi:hypothetical protein F4813DRAFT_372232 [Daldinia decipiens]|uniref:uncharacterized protein n=1 Tax=Daldinia decipiens TaxID=326647 RepID=UPI0020C2F70B|nr:uncharacterized protein F4813DRAFT_372232 [Daldinia decipiens]KAI1654084.1 hypothetical protein F4813DRAFT_372232 [Daldinia decipiens]